MINVGFINKAAVIKPFIIEIQMQLSGTYTLGLLGNNELEIDWGDGLVQQTTQDNPTHNYESSGRYTIKCSGKSSQILFRKQNELVDVKQWGTNKWRTLEYAFADCRNIGVFSAKDVPDLSNITSLKMMFFCSTFREGNLAKWDVSNVTNMTGVFYQTAFNENINDWDVSNVIDMSTMFCNANWFNKKLNKWDVGRVSNMRLTFFNARSFNQDISKWDISQVSNMRQMLAGTKVTPNKYDKLLISWGKLARETPHTPFSNPHIYKQFGISTTYCQGEIARQSLIDNYGFGNDAGGLNDKGKNCPESKTN